MIVQALLEGRQCILLRKGGISENEGRFTIESHDFILYPTKVHQDPKGLLNIDATQVVQAAADQIAADHVLLKAFAHVEHYERLRDWETVKALGAHHVWSGDTVRQRFEWGAEQWLDFFLLRVHRLPKPVELANDPAFGGCKSWISLPQSIDVAGAQPVLSDARFAQERKALMSIVRKSATAA